MRPAYFTVTPSIDADGIAATQSVAAPGDLTLNGALASGGVWEVSGFGQLVTIRSAGNDVGVTFTVYGISPEGVHVSQPLTGANNGDVTTDVYFRKVTRIAVSAACAGNVYAGVLGEAATPAFVVNYKMKNFKASLSVDVTGTINGTVQHTFDDVFVHGLTAADWTWFSNDDAALVGFTTDKDGNYAFPPTATRVVVNSASAGGSIKYAVIVPA